MRYFPLLVLVACVPAGWYLGISQPFWGALLFGLGLFGSFIGMYDVFQKNHAVLKNYPVLARLGFSSRVSALRFVNISWKVIMKRSLIRASSERLFISVQRISKVCGPLVL